MWTLVWQRAWRFDWDCWILFLGPFIGGTCRAPSLWDFDVLLCASPKDETFFALRNSLSDSTKWIRPPITSSPVGGGLRYATVFFFGMAKAHGDSHGKIAEGSCGWEPPERPADGSCKCKVMDWSLASCPNTSEHFRTLPITVLVILEPLGCARLETCQWTAMWQTK